ncbi:hypothetical protein GM540_17340, partial [Streptococcus pneumoniae]|nr:hypothetical protein [Streptococcus pneumoniae]
MGSRQRLGGVNDLNREVELLKAKGAGLDLINSAENKALETEIKLSEAKLKRLKDLPDSALGRKAIMEERD